ncbi:30S ribosomal protein S13 [Candidatus Bathyarchaeota archaeon]|nr:MAG: 30S ribosomal protein S13 [Candidatus Bathyarchaeota archaeon]
MSTEYKHIVRLAGSDLEGSRKVVYALTKIKGINVRLADAIVKRANIPQDKRLGFLSESEIRRLEDIIMNITSFDIPKWLLNRRKDLASGEDIHLITSDLDLKVKEDIEREKAMRSWRGYRHSYGLKVRGQRTRTTGRKGRTIGVKKRRR